VETEKVRKIFTHFAPRRRGGDLDRNGTEQIILLNERNRFSCERKV